MCRYRRWVVLVGLYWTLPPDSARAAIAGLELVASGLSSPVFATYAPGDRDRLFIVERGSPGNSSDASASIRILNLKTGELEATPFLTIPDIDNHGEGGLLGLAFHPDYQSNGKFYTYLTSGDAEPDTVYSSYVREYTVSSNPNIADASFHTVVTWGQPQIYHNGGWIGFSPNDNYLYIAVGDGGADPRNAQDITDSLLGKMLRIDVDGDDFPADAQRNYSIPQSNPFVGVNGDDEIWAYGLRNPWRDSFDRLTGDLWIGDVGQDTREEIDFQPADSPGGENYGWPLREGTIAAPGDFGGDPPSGNVEPIYDYTHGRGEFQGNVVTGGYVYRGPDPSLQGTYFFTDNGSGYMWTMDANTYEVQDVGSMLAPDMGNVANPASFGEDAVGNLYVVSFGNGNIFRITTNELLLGDYNADGDVDNEDYVVWKTNFGVTSGAGLAADGNGDNAINAADYTVWRDHLGDSVQLLGTSIGGSAVPEPAAVTILFNLTVLLSLCVRSRGKL
jgi:glucose/arabinose dehydrogenase